MKHFFEIKDGSLVGTVPERANIVVYALPDDSEKHQLLEMLGHDWHDLESALDPDEISRVDFDAEDTYIIWKQPSNVSPEKELKFEVSSIGFFLQKNRLTVIHREDSPVFIETFQKLSSLNGLVLRFFLYTVHHYLDHLKSMKQMAAELQTKLNISTENHYLLQMFNLSENLIYYINALEANSSVLTRLRGHAEKLGLSDEELAMLDDILIDHQQCSRQTEVFYSVLSGLMDARGNIINNNMNVLLKNLTLINVVFLPLNLIASIGGMSEYSKITSGIGLRTSYSVFLLVMGLLGWITWVVLIRRINQQRSIQIGREQWNR